MKKKHKNAFDEAAGLIGRYEKGEASPAEREALGGWLPAADTEPLPQEEAQRSSLCEKQVWERLSLRFHLGESAGQPAAKRRSLRPLICRCSGVAAMLLLIIGSAWLLADRNGNPQPTDACPAFACSAPVSGIVPHELPDGSRAELNRESTLTAGSDFGQKRRSVKMQGQIFFDVAKNPRKPFVVDAAGIDVTVRGTSFEIVAYDGIPERAVTVCTGSVEVRNPRDGKLLATLTPGRQLIFNPATGKSEIRKVDAAALTAWREGRLVLHNASLAELRLRLRQYFGKRLEIENNALPADVRITSSFSYDELTAANVMARLCALFRLRSRTEGNRIILSPDNG